MDSRAFLGLQRSHNPYRWHLEVTPGLATGGNFLFGGCGLGAAISAMEGTTDRPCVWATAQYLSYAAVGSILDLDVTVAASGRHLSQARCVGRVGDTEIFTVNAALGSRPFELNGLWEHRPDVPPPEDCPVRLLPRTQDNSVLTRVEVRVAAGRQFEDLDGTPSTGRSALWARMPEVLDVSAAALAVLGDFVPASIGQALGRGAGGNSLDNTLRIAHRVPTEWVLADVRVHAVGDGFGHGLVHLWSQDGVLLGTASQSTIVRAWREDQQQPLTELEGDVR